MKHPAQIARFDVECRAWVARRGLAPDRSARGYRGSYRGLGLLVRPGIEGSAPISVEVELTIASWSHTDVQLITLRAPGRGELAEKLFDVIADDALRSDLKSIAILATGLRLRLSALVDIDILELALDRVVDVVEASRATQGGPYRGT